MGTIRLRKRKDNTTAYCAHIRINRDGRPVYQETQTFDRKQIDEARMKRREAELAVPYAIHKPHLPNDGLTVYCGIFGEQFH
ncbi:hypothetical protein V2K58_25550, partial [Pseudomonas alliivorans]|nr:hypothetical protein [Pseudomonas alliivorans]